MFNIVNTFIALACLCDFGQGEFQANASIEVMQGAIALEAPDMGVTSYFGPAAFNPSRSEYHAAGFVHAADDTLTVSINADTETVRLRWISRYNAAGVDECVCRQRYD